MKATIVIFGNISKSEGASVSFFNYRILRYFKNLNAISQVYCLDSNIDASDDIHFLIDKFSGTFVSKFLFRLAIVVCKILPFLSLRYIMEWLFDLFVTNKFTPSKTDLVINLKATTPNLCRKAKLNSLSVVSIVTISHPEFIFQQIYKLQQSYGLKDRSPYMNKLWRNRYIKGLTESNIAFFRLSSDYVKNTYLEHGFDSKKLVSPRSNNGVSIDRFKKKKKYCSEGKVIFLAVGGNTLKKGILLLLDAWSQVGKEFDQKIHLLIVDKLNASMRKVISERKFDKENITFLEYTQQIEEIYQKADVFITSTVADLGPRTVTEAMTVGLPCIVSDQCGMAEWITEGEDGLTYPAFSIDELKEAIEYFARSSSRIPSMGQAARNKVLGFSTSEFGRELFQLCQGQVNNLTS